MMALVACWRQLPAGYPVPDVCLDRAWWKLGGADLRRRACREGCLEVVIKRSAKHAARVVVHPPSDARQSRVVAARVREESNPHSQ